MVRKGRARKRQFVTNNIIMQYVETKNVVVIIVRLILKER